MPYTISVGVDVAARTFVVHVATQSGEPIRLRRTTFDNTQKGIAAFLNVLTHLSVDIVVLEPTGGYERALTAALHQAQIPVFVAHPGRMRDYARGIGRLAKTDKVDALCLADYGLSRSPKPTPAPDADLEALEALRQRHRQLIDQRSAEKNRLAQAPAVVHQDIQDHIDWLDQKIADLDRKIQEQIAAVPALRDKSALLLSAPGVGPATQAALIAGLPELGHLGPKQIASLVGVAPVPCDSGEKNGKRYIQGGRASVRTALYMATLSAVRVNSTFRTHYQKLLAAGKAKKVALIACARKMLLMLNAMVRDARPWCQTPARA